MDSEQDKKENLVTVKSNGEISAEENEKKLFTLNIQKITNVLTNGYKIIQDQELDFKETTVNLYIPQDIHKTLNEISKSFNLEISKINSSLEVKLM